MYARDAEFVWMNYSVLLSCRRRPRAYTTGGIDRNASIPMIVPFCSLAAMTGYIYLPL